MRQNHFLVYLLLFVLNVNAQFNNIGASIGVSLPKQHFTLKPLQQDVVSNVFTGFNAQFHVEFGENTWFSHRWEAQYNNKGGRGTLSGIDYAYRNLTAALYYLFKPKFETKYVNPFLLLGSGIEYSFKHNFPFEPSILELDNLINSSGRRLGLVGVAGAGAEVKEILGQWIPFTEILFAPNLLDYFNSDLVKMRSTNWEIRLGMKFKFDVMKNFENCPPVNPNKPKKRKSSKKGNDGSKIFR
jgi:hypothetical protein